jgi:hypothetical protein
MTLPANNAFSEPMGEAVTFEEGKPITDWKDGHQTIAWYGDLKQTGSLHLTVSLRVPTSETVGLKLTLSGRERPDSPETKLPPTSVTIRGAEDDQTADFGTVTILHPGYWRFALTGMKKTGETFGAITGLTLTGDAVKDASINRSQWRSPASVHLGYPVPAGTKVAMAYNEVTAREDPIHTYYCAIGFGRGYFGMQVNGPHERRIIFSIWDAGKEPTDPKKVSDEDRVVLLAKGDGVFTDRFGNEGTGGHSHLVYNWKTGQPQRFLVTAKPDGTGTIYTGYFYFSIRKKWDLIASFRAPHDGGYLTGLYSFNEVFGGDYGQKQRRALFGRQFICDVDGHWQELTHARFTHTARNQPLVRRDWGGGSQGDRFYLVNGGFITEQTNYADIFTRTPSKEGPPTDISLPTIPALVKGG